MMRIRKNGKMEEVKRWLRQGESDLEKAEVLFENGNFDGTAFYCQQAVEKTLKALMLKEKKGLIKTHSVLRLAREINAESEILKSIEKIGPIYQTSRYPDVSPEMPYEAFSKEDAQEFLDITEVLRWTKKKI